MYNPKKRTYQNIKEVMDISEQRMALDTEFLQKGKEMEDKNVDKKNLENFNKNENEEEEIKDYIVYLDDSNESSEILQELKKNKDLKLNCLLYKKDDLLEIPLWLTDFPFFIDTKTKKAYVNDECLKFIKTIKVCKSRVKTGGKTLQMW